MSNADNSISFEIQERIGTIAVYPTGWSKELNLVSWNDGMSKYDIRDWSPDHGSMSRGITLKESEMKRITDLMASREKVAEAKEKLAQDHEMER